MNPKSHSGGKALAVVALIAAASMALLGCTSNRIDDLPEGEAKEPPLPGATPSLSVDDKARVDSAWARYMELNKIYVQAGQTGSYNWDDDLTKRPMYPFAGGPLLVTLENDLDFMREENIIRTGESAITLRRIVSVSPTSILVESCVDDTKTDAINKTTRKSVAAPGQNKVYPVTLRAGLYPDGQWRWVESHADRSSSC
jgi:hypothetical protein